jgi:hypothetical protein
MHCLGDFSQLVPRATSMVPSSRPNSPGASSGCETLSLCTDPLALHCLRGDALYIPRQARLLHYPDEPPRWIELPSLQAVPS